MKDKVRLRRHTTQGKVEGTGGMKQGPVCRDLTFYPDGGRRGYPADASGIGSDV